MVNVSVTPDADALVVPLLMVTVLAVESTAVTVVDEAMLVPVTVLPTAIEAVLATVTVVLPDVVEAVVVVVTLLAVV